MTTKEEKAVLSREQIGQHCICLKDVVGDLFPSIDDPSREYYLELIDELGKAALSRSAPEWVSVEKRLPEDARACVLAVTNSNRIVIVVIDFLRANPGEYTHWMPLPPASGAEAKP